MCVCNEWGSKGRGCFPFCLCNDVRMYECISECGHDFFSRSRWYPASIACWHSLPSGCRARFCLYGYANLICMMYVDWEPSPVGTSVHVWTWTKICRLENPMVLACVFAVFVGLESNSQARWWCHAVFSIFTHSGINMHAWSHQDWCTPTHAVRMQIQPMDDNSTKLPLMNVTMSEIMQSKWVDLKTRAIFFDFSFYNPNLDIFLVSRTTVEFLPSGVVSLSAIFRTVDPFR